MFDYWRAAALVKITKYRDTACLEGGSQNRIPLDLFATFILKSQELSLLLGTYYMLDDCFLKRTQYPYHHFPCKMGMNCKWLHFERFKESMTPSLGEAETYLILTLQMKTCWVPH